MTDTPACAPTHTHFKLYNVLLFLSHWLVHINSALIAFTILRISFVIRYKRSLNLEPRGSKTTILHTALYMAKPFLSEVSKAFYSPCVS